MKKINLLSLLSLLAVPVFVGAMDVPKSGKPVPSAQQQQQMKAMQDKYAVTGALTGAEEEEELSFEQMLKTPQEEVGPGVATQAVGAADAASKRLQKLRKGRLSRYTTKGEQRQLQQTAAKSMAIAVGGSSKLSFSSSRAKAARQQLKNALTSKPVNVPNAITALGALSDEYTKKVTLKMQDLKRMGGFETGAQALLKLVLSQEVPFSGAEFEVVVRQLKIVIDNLRELGGKMEIYPAEQKRPKIYVIDKYYHAKGAHIG